VKPTTAGKKAVQPEENNSPGKAALPAGTRSPARQAHTFLEGYEWDGRSAVPTRPKSARAPLNSTMNVNSIEFLTTRSRNLEASLAMLQKKCTATTAELAVSRKQVEEGAARLNALEA